MLFARDSLRGSVANLFLYLKKAKTLINVKILYVIKPILLFVVFITTEE